MCGAEEFLADGPKQAEAWFHQRATEYVMAQIVFHLNQVGVFRVLTDRDKPQSSEQLADELGLVRSILDTLLEYVWSVDDILIRDPESRYSLSTLGKAIAARYGRPTESGTHLNLFDVRVGAYGPVWSELSGMLTGEKTYGETVKRTGAFAERGLYATARGMGPSLLDALSPNNGPVLELGVETGLLEYVGQARPELSLYGLDRNLMALQNCITSAEAEGIEGIQGIQADLRDVETWASRLKGTSPGTIFSIHMHEFMAMGRTSMVDLVGLMIEHLKGWRVVFFEQPKPLMEGLTDKKESLWLASHSNILIHHLIKNGKILSKSEWTRLITEAGGTVSSVVPSGYLDYDRYLVEL